MRPPSIPTTIPVFRETDTKQTIIMKTLYNTLINYKEPKTQRLLIQVFMCLPSRKDFPEYFNIIERPISMNKIRDRIEKQQYIDEAACMEDFKLMFSNCKFFNEDDSQIYNDASTLEYILVQRREELLNEYNVSGNNDSQDGPNRLSNNSYNNNDNVNHRQNNNNNINNQTPTYRSERLANKSTTNEDIKPLNKSSSSSSSPTKNNYLGSPNKRNNQHNTSSSVYNNHSPATNNDNQKATLNNNNHHDSPRSASPNRAKLDSWQLNNNRANNNSSNNANNNNNNNGILHDSNDSDTQQSGSNISSSARLLNGKNDMGSEDSSAFNVIQNHNHNHDVSMDSVSNISSDLVASTPIEKCSLNNRRGRNSDAPKRQLLTGYIIYASEIRKEVIDKNPDQTFGDISRLVGNEWKALPRDVRSKYDQRALIHNKRVRDLAARNLQNPEAARLSNGFHTPKLTKKKLAKLAKERLRQEALLAKSGRTYSTTPSAQMDNNSNGAGDTSFADQSPNNSFTGSTQAPHTPGQPQSHHHHQYHGPSHLKHQTAHSPAFQHNQPTGRPPTTETATQTTALRFVGPSNKKRLSYSETFRKYIQESLQVPNKDQLNEELGSERPHDKPMQWLGGGIGRHESPQAALWALRDFMLQDSGTMRRNLQPYI